MRKDSCLLRNEGENDDWISIEKDIKMNAINNMLEFQMLMLENVNDDAGMFRKELQKSKKWLKFKDLVTLKQWSLKKFQRQHRRIIHDILDDVPV